MRTFLALLAAVALAGCATQSERAGLMASSAPASAASPCGGPAASGPVLLANEGTYRLAAPVGVEYRVGPDEHARAAIMVPANVAACVTDGAAKGLVLLGDTLRCITANLWPNPQPTQRLLYADPVSRGAGPCAPPMAAPPPKSAPCAPPVAVVPEKVCVGKNCEVASGGK